MIAADKKAKSHWAIGPSGHITRAKALKDGWRWATPSDLEDSANEEARRSNRPEPYPAPAPEPEKPAEKPKAKPAAEKK